MNTKADRTMKRILDAITWSSNTTSIKDIGVNKACPQLIKFDDSPNIYYLHACLKSYRILAECVSSTQNHGKRAKRSYLTIPILYSGFFDTVSEDGRTAPPLRSVAELASVGPSQCLVLAQVQGYLPDNAGRPHLGLPVVIQSGELLKLIAQERTKTSDGVLGSTFLRVQVKSSNSTVFLEAKTRGSFIQIGHDSDLDGAHDIMGIIQKFRLPLRVKVLSGQLPQLQDIQNHRNIRLQTTYLDQIALIQLLTPTGALRTMHLGFNKPCYFATNINELNGIKEWEGLQHRGKLGLKRYMTSIQTVSSLPPNVVINKAGFLVSSSPVEIADVISTLSKQKYILQERITQSVSPKVMSAQEIIKLASPMHSIPNIDTKSKNYPESNAFQDISQSLKINRKPQLDTIHSANISSEASQLSEKSSSLLPKSEQSVKSLEIPFTPEHSTEFCAQSPSLPEQSEKPTDPPIQPQQLSKSLESPILPLKSGNSTAQTLLPKQPEKSTDPFPLLEQSGRHSNSSVLMEQSEKSSNPPLSLEASGKSLNSQLLFDPSTFTLGLSENSISPALTDPLQHSADKIFPDFNVSEVKTPNTVELGRRQLPPLSPPAEEISDMELDAKLTVDDLEMFEMPPARGLYEKNHTLKHTLSKQTVFRAAGSNSIFDGSISLPRRYRKTSATATQSCVRSPTLSSFSQAGNIDLSHNDSGFETLTKASPTNRAVYDSALDKINSGNSYLSSSKMETNPQELFVPLFSSGVSVARHTKPRRSSRVPNHLSKRGRRSTRQQRWQARTSLRYRDTKIGGKSLKRSKSVPATRKEPIVKLTRKKPMPDRDALVKAPVTFFKALKL